ncbi:MAG: zinc-ribbon domain-containing protein [Candidatus Viridilinea halotolerans]|uniref:Zinc-ribbon domain-containing protein n=1 Tax=Candidatus Viridilinea halotolerans TaxID=2491704 RepID=A0A426TTJ0_9CHLR|nr:MAG: zinc-ribbon domain-containing protein [Candidatus Viridilinea halotolerans]
MSMCPTCGAQNDPGNRFCDQCGTRLTAEGPSNPTSPPSPVAPPDMPTAAAPLCPACGATVLPGEAFCDNCGASLSGAVAAVPIVDVQADIPTQPAGAVASAGSGGCWSCGAAVLPGERFCDNCGADLQAAPSAAPAPPVSAVDEHDQATVIAPPPAPSAPPAPVVDEHDQATMIAPPPAPPAPVEDEHDQATMIAPPPAPPPAPVEDEHDQATMIAPPPAPPAPPPAPPATPDPVAVPIADEPAPAAPAPPAEVPVVPAPPAPVVDEHDQATMIAPPVTPDPVAVPIEAEATPAAAAPPAAAPVAAAPPAADTDVAAQRGELEAEIARQQQIITQFEQMQATFGAATPPAVITGLDEARQALAKAQTALAALPTAPTVDPALVKGLEDEIGRQRQIIAQFEQMQAMFGAATPPAVLAGLDEARQALIRAEGELHTLGVSLPPAAAATTIPAPAAPATPAAPVAPVAPTGPRMVVLDGGHVIPLPGNKSEIIVGREDPVSNIYPEVDLTAFGGEAGGVSRQHARITLNAGQWNLYDLNSTNHTRVDGTRLEPNQPHPLHDGARVQFGRIVLTFHL